MRRSISLLIILLLLGGVLFSGEATELKFNASVAANNSLGLAKTTSALLLAYQGSDGVYLSDIGAGSSQKVAGGNLNQIAAQGELVVIAYEVSKQPFVIVSRNGGVSFEYPIALTGTGQDAAVQGIAIDEAGIIHIVFHRHNRYWDYNYSRSSDGGRTFQTQLDFTRSTDSNSTGYSSRLVAGNGNLYTLYQDNNDKFSIKLGLSKDSGAGWQIRRFTSTPGGRLALALDRQNPAIAYMAALNAEGLSISRINGASSSNPTYWPLYVDEGVKPVGGKNTLVEMVVTEDNTIAVVYPDPTTQSYYLLTSRDGGEGWLKEELGSALNPAIQEYRNSLLVADGGLYCAHLNREGKIVLHTIGSTLPQYRTDDMGFVMADIIPSEFEVISDQEYLWIFFSVDETGYYEIKHLTHDYYHSLMLLFDLSEDAEATLGDNIGDFDLKDSLFAHLTEGVEYVMVVTFMDYITGRIDFRFKVTPMVAPVKKAIDILPLVGVAAGAYTSFYLDGDWRLYGTGLNHQGQLGDNPNRYLSSFSQLRSDIARIYPGANHTLYLTDERKLYVSGRNEDYQIGDGTQEPRHGFYLLSSNVIDAAAGYGHTLYLLEDGSVWALGANNYGQLGDGTTEHRLKPVKIFEGAKRVYTSLGSSSYILSKDGTLYGFGDNSAGQLGQGHTINAAKPQVIARNVRGAAAGMNYLMVVKEDDTLWGVGGNSNGQLGTKDQTSRLTLTQVATNVSKVATGYYTTYYFDFEGNLKGSGSNQYGQFGLGSTQNPSLKGGFIDLLDDVIDVAAGRNHVVVLTRDRRVLTAGLNDYGQLGDTTEGFSTRWREVFKEE